jgi:hypothetical protein
MRLNEALYFAFVIGWRGCVRRNEWETEENTKHQFIDACCHPSDEDDSSWYISINDKPFSYVVLDDNLREKIKQNLKSKTRSNYGLDLTEKDIKADDWRVDSLMYIYSNEFERSIK